MSSAEQYCAFLLVSVFFLNSSRWPTDQNDKGYLVTEDVCFTGLLFQHSTREGLAWSFPILQSSCPAASRRDSKPKNKNLWFTGKKGVITSRWYGKAGRGPRDVTSELAVMAAAGTGNDAAGWIVGSGDIILICKIAGRPVNGYAVPGIIPGITVPGIMVPPRLKLRCLHYDNCRRGGKDGVDVALTNQKYPCPGPGHRVRDSGVSFFSIKWAGQRSEEPHEKSLNSSSQQGFWYPAHHKR